MYDMHQRCGYVLGRPHVEALPFPWPMRTVFYFYVPGRLAPAPIYGTEPRGALGDDGFSVRASWIFQVVREAVKTFGATAGVV